MESSLTLFGRIFQYGVGFMGPALMALVGCILAFGNGPLWLRILGGLLFIPGFLAALLAFRGTSHKGPHLIISDEGVEYTPDATGLMAWERIESIQVRETGDHQLGNMMIRLHPSADEELPVASSCEAGRVDRGGDLSKVEIGMMFHFMKPGFDEILGYLRKHHPEKIGMLEDGQTVPAGGA